jgi:hypothetical protein
MATKTSLVINAVNDGKQIQKTLTDINPTADNGALKVWGQMLNGLTTNTYVKTDRIDKTNCDTYETKLTPNVALDPAAAALTRSACLVGASPLINITTDGELSIVNNDNTTWCTTLRLGADTGRYRLYIGVINEATVANATAPHDIVIRTTETDNYYAGEFIITINPDS